MHKNDDARSALQELKAEERAIVLSFLSFSERRLDEDSAAMDQLALSMAIRSAIRNSAN